MELIKENAYKIAIRQALNNFSLSSGALGKSRCQSGMDEAAFEDWLKGETQAIILGWGSPFDEAFYSTARSGLTI